MTHFFFDSFPLPMIMAHVLMEFVSETPYIEVLVDFLNETFSALSKVAVTVWTKPIEPEIVR